MSQSVAVSGVSQVGQSLVYITYDQPQFPYGLPDPNPFRSKDIVPGFMYYMGSVVYEKDAQGNMVARNKRMDE